MAEYHSNALLSSACQRSLVVEHEVLFQDSQVSPKYVEVSLSIRTRAGLGVRDLYALESQKCQSRMRLEAS